MWQRYVRPALGTLLIGGLAMVLGCSEKPTVPLYQEEEFKLSIIGGPETSGGAVGYGSRVTFKWQAVGGNGAYTYKYKLDGGAWLDVPPGQTSVILSETSVLTTGIHTFTIQATSGGSPIEASREFTVGPIGARDTAAPVVTITFPTAGFMAAPGSSVRIAWTVTDESNATIANIRPGIAAIGWAVDDTAAAATWAFSDAIPLSGFADNLAVGTHKIFVRAQDLSGNVTIVEFTLDVVAPVILVINETVSTPGYSGHESPLSMAQEFGRGAYFAKIFEGYAWSEWNVETQGNPTTADIPASVKAIVWVGSGDYHNSSWGWNVGWEYTYNVATGGALAPNVLTDFIDAGGKVWIAGENWLDEINVGVDNPVEDGLEYKYLAMDTLSASVGAPIISYDFAPLAAGWPSLSTDIAKLESGLGDGGGWTADFAEFLRPNAVPLYRISGADLGDGLVDPATVGEDDLYAAWYVKDAANKAQVVFMGFDIYYFSVENAKQVTRKVLTGLFGL